MNTDTSSTLPVKRGKVFALTLPALLMLSFSPLSAQIVWDGEGPNRDWSTALNWNTNAAIPDAAAVVFNQTNSKESYATPSDYTASIISLDTTIASLRFRSTVNGGDTEATKRIVTHEIHIQQGVTLNITGTDALDVGDTATGMQNVAINAVFSGAGTLKIDNANAIIDVDSTGAPSTALGNKHHLDLRSLGAFEANISTLNIGSGTFNYSIGEVSLSNTYNHITANTINVGNSTTNGTPGVGASLRLGAGTNIINATTLTVGAGKQNNTEMKFAESTGTLQMAGKTAGTGININVAISAGPATGGHVQATLDLRGHQANIVANQLIVGERSTNAGNNANPQATGHVYFDNGTFSANQVLLGVRRSTSAVGQARGTLTIGGGSGTATFTVNQGGTFQLGGNTGTGSGGLDGRATGTVNILAGGTLISHAHITDGGNSNTGAESHSIINLNGGTLDMRGYSIGSATHKIDELNFQSGILMDVGEINGGGSWSKTGTGTLILDGINTHTATTNVLAGTLLVNGLIHENAGSYQVAFGGTLGGIGWIALGEGKSVSVTGNLSVGDSTFATPTASYFAISDGDVIFNTRSSLNLDITSGTQADVLDLVYADEVVIADNAALKISSVANLSDWNIGDTWKLIDWGATPVTGTFSFVDNSGVKNLGYSWDISRLYIDGTISLIEASPDLTWIASGSTTNLQWNNPATWDANLTPTLSTNITFNSVGTVTTPSTPTSIVTESTTISSLTFDFSDVNASHVLQIDPGAVLDVNGSYNLETFAGSTDGVNAPMLVIPTVFAVGVNSSLNAILNTSVTIEGGGSLRINNPAADMLVAIPYATGTSNSHYAVLDLSGLGSFSANVRNLHIGYHNSAVGTLKLSDTSNHIVADLVTIGFTDGRNSNGGVNNASALYLGRGENAIYTNKLIVGGSKTLGSMKASGPGGTLILAGKDGGSSTVDINMATWTVNTSALLDSVMDLRGMVAHVQAGTIIAGSKNSSTTSTSGATANIYFEAGTFTVKSLQMAIKAGTFTGSASATLHISGGDFTVVEGGSFILATHAASSNIYYGSANGIVNLTGGTLTSHVDIQKSNGNATLNVDGGTLDMTNHNIGTATQAINNLNFKRGTIKNIKEINGGGGWTKTGTGILTLEGINTYSGSTTVNEGVLQLNGDNVHTNAGNYLVKAGAKLSGTGSLKLAQNKSITVEGRLSVGDVTQSTPAASSFSISTSGAGGSLVFAENSFLEFDITAPASAANSADLLELDIQGSLTINNHVSLVLSSIPSMNTWAVGDTWKLIDWGNAETTVTGSFEFVDLTNVTSWGLSWDLAQLYSHGTVTLTMVPEPGRAALLMTSTILFLLRRSRKHLA
jgi:autotransporter-associated beta strand protein